MSAMTERQANLKRLWEMVGDINVCMLASWDGSQMHSRPMYAHREEGTDEIWFYTKLDSGATAETALFDKVNLAFADAERKNWVSISGKAVIERDPAKIGSFWSPMVAAWFPQGQNDPDLAMIRIEPDSAQYWDSTTSTMKYLWEIGKAQATGTTPDVGEVGHVDFKRPA